MSPAPTTISTSTPKTKHQEDHFKGLTRDSDDDDISLAKCMTRKLQLNQQMYPWMSPSLAALHQQHDSPASRDSTYAINKYSYTQYHQIQLQLQLQYQQQLMLQYQQQQQQQNLVGYNGPSLGQYHRHHHHRHQQRSPGMKHQSIIRKSKSAQLDDADHDLQTRMSPTTSTHRMSCSSLDNSSSTNTSKNDSQRQRYSLLSLPSDSMKKNHHSQRGYRQRQEISSPATPVAKQSVTRRSSIYSHASATSISTASASNLTSITNELTQSPASTSHSKPSLSKRIRGVILGRNTNKQTHTASSSASSSLRRSSSVASGTSSVIDHECGSSRSLWTTLLRKSSRSGPANYDVEKQFVHGKRSNGQKGMAPDSPASSVSGGSYHRSFLHHENGFVDDLPSPASSTSPESPLNYPGNHPDSLQRIGSTDQLDYFGPSPPLSQQQQAKTSPYTFLQHGSPRLQPSANNQQNGSSFLVSESDNFQPCLLETPIPSNSIKSPVITLLPISSASTSTSSLALERQQSGNTKSTTKSNARIQFATTIQVHETFGSQDYDRRCDTQVTCQRLTTILALQIKKELNEYKLNEMQVHLQSRQNTQFFL